LPAVRNLQVRGNAVSQGLGRRSKHRGIERDILKLNAACSLWADLGFRQEAPDAGTQLGCLVGNALRLMLQPCFAIRACAGELGVL